MAGIIRLDLRGIPVNQVAERIEDFVDSNNSGAVAVNLNDAGATAIAADCLRALGFSVEKYANSGNYFALGREPGGPELLVWYDGASWQVASEEAEPEANDEEPIIDLVRPLDDEEPIEGEIVLDDDDGHGQVEDNLLDPGTEEALEAALEPDNSVIMIGSRFMGHGDENLGSKLATAFFDTLAALGRPPRLVAFYNSGVFLSTHQSTALDAIKDLAGQGTEIISCGVCLEYYQLKDQLKVGRIGNMYEIINAQRNAESIIQF